jgi:hypothetical protein
MQLRLPAGSIAAPAGIPTNDPVESRPFRRNDDDGRQSEQHDPRPAHDAILLGSRDSGACGEIRSQTVP